MSSSSLDCEGCHAGGNRNPAHSSHAALIARYGTPGGVPPMSLRRSRLLVLPRASGGPERREPASRHRGRSHRGTLHHSRDLESSVGSGGVSRTSSRFPGSHDGAAFPLGRRTLSHRGGTGPRRGGRRRDRRRSRRRGSHPTGRHPAHPQSGNRGPGFSLRLHSSLRDHVLPDREPS